VSETKFHELKGIELFDVGTWNGRTYDDEDLDEMVENFQELSAAGYDFPGKLGHGEQELLEREDLPAAAYIKRLYRRGTKLVADLTRVPEKVKTVIELGAYRTVSAEIFDKVQLLGKTYKNVLGAFAFLGGEIPAVGTLDDIVTLYNRPKQLLFSELHGARRTVVSFAAAKAIGSHTTKKAAEDEAWDAGAEVKAADVDDLRAMCAYVTGDGEAKGDYHLPHHRASDHAVVWKGVVAAGNVVQGARGASIPSSVITGVKTHLEKHYGQFDRTAPWEEDVTKNAADDSVDDEVEELHDELAKLAERAADATRGRTGAPAFRAFLRDTIAKLRGLGKKTKNAAADMSFEDRRELVSAAVRLKWGSVDGYGAWITEMYDDQVIVSRDGSYWQVPYAIDDNDNVSLGEAVEVEQIWQSKNKAGSTGKEDDMAITKALATALGLPETADEPAVLKAITDLKADKTKHAATDESEVKTLREEVTKLRAESTERTATDAVTAAIDAHKLLPAQQDWAKSYAARDPEGFKTFIASQPTVFDTDEKGSGADAPGAKSDVAQFQAKVAEKLKADKDLSVEEAQRQVASEEPELFAAIRARR